MDEYFKKIILDDFGEADDERVVSELESVTLKHVMANSLSQLESAYSIILQESKGDLDRLDSLVKLAKTDYKGYFNLSKHVD